MFSKAARAFARTRRARPAIVSLVEGFCLCGIDEEPCGRPSRTSPISVRCRFRISVAIFSSVPATIASVVSTWAWRSRCSDWLLIDAGSSPSLSQTRRSTSGSTFAYVPTEPEIFPTAMTALAASSRSRSR